MNEKNYKEALIEDISEFLDSYDVTDIEKMWELIIDAKNFKMI